MKKILLVGVSAISMLSIENVNAADIKPFIGGNVAINGVIWSNDADQNTRDIGIDLPDAFIGLGLEAGVKFVNNNIYNAGITLVYDYAFDSEAKLDSYIKQYYYDVSTGFSSISVTFDNYIRISGEKAHRRDIVLGVGLANGTERISVKTTYYGEVNGLKDVKEKDDGRAFVLKIGYNHQMADNIDWYVNGRTFIFSGGDKDVNSMFNFSTGLRYVF